MNAGSLAAAALGLAAAAQAQPPAPMPAPAQEIVVTARVRPGPDGAEPRVVTRAVPLAGLDLGRWRGEREMRRRVEAAVRELCASPSPVGYYEARLDGTCRAEATADARRKMDHLVRRAQARAAAR